MQQVVREVVRDVGYTEADMGISADHCSVLVAIHEQSPDIAMGVDDDAARGQGHRRRRPGPDVRLRLQRHARADAAADRAVAPHSQSPDRSPQEGRSDWLRPDSKSQVTVEYDGKTPVRIDTVVVSTQHGADVSNAEIQKYIIEKIDQAVAAGEWASDDITYHINPTGRFVVGGPHGDCGLTGRKIIVDTYGGWGRHGGGAFSGKDPTKVDRSAAYMARYVAKNIVASGLADRCEVQLAYAIGVSEPVSVLRRHRRAPARSTTSGSASWSARSSRSRPAGIIKHLDLRRPIYRKTAAGGHFGRSEPEFTWEKTDKAKRIGQGCRGNRRGNITNREGEAPAEHSPTANARHGRDMARSRRRRRRLAPRCRR